MKKYLLTCLFGITVYFGSNFNLGNNWKCSASAPNDVYLETYGLETATKYSLTNSPYIAPVSNGLISALNAKPTKSYATTSTQAIQNENHEDLAFALPGHDASVSTLAFSYNGKLLASGGWDNTIKVWDLKKKKLVFELNNHTGGITSLAFHPKNLFLASTSLDSSIRVWGIKIEGMGLQSGNTSNQNNYYASSTNSKNSDTNDYTIFPALTIKKAHNNWINTIAYSPNGRYLASGGWDNLIKIWDAQTGNCVKTLKGHQSAILDIKFSKDGKTLISSSQDETIKFWSIASGKLVHQITGHSGWIMSISLDAKESILASGGSDETISLWDIATKQDTALEINRFLGHKDYVRSLDFSPDGNILASGGDDNKLKFWNLKTGKEIYEIEGHTSWVRSVKYSPDGKLVASAGDDQKINLWKTEKAVELMKQNAELVKKKTVSASKKITYRRKALIKRKCNRCHTYRAVESKFNPRNITDIVKRMQSYPNSGLSNRDVNEIIRYLKTTVKSSY